MRCLATVTRLLLLGTGLASAGCNSHGKTIGLLTPTTGVVMWDSLHAGTVAQSATCGMRVHYDGPPREDDLGRQLELLKSFVEANYAAIIVAPIEERALRNPIERTADRGVQVIVVGVDLGVRRPNITYLLNDEEKGGELAANEFGSLLPGGGEIAIAGIDPKNTILYTREHAFEQQIERKFPKIHVVNRMRGSTDLAEEEQTVETVLQAHPMLAGVLALSAEATRAAFYARDAQANRPRVHIVGFDQDLTLPVRSGEIDAIIAMRANEIGRLAARVACVHELGGGQWQHPLLVQPFLVTSINLGTPEVQTQFDQNWTKNAKENK